MLQAPPALPGMAEHEIDTPALVLDLDAFEHNLDRMASLLAPTGTKLRAHAKTHKSPVVALQQIKRGAVGQCVQKVGEAEVMAWGGVPDILVSNEVVGDSKLARFAALSNLATVAICADHPHQVERLAAVAETVGKRLTVLVEIDVGAARAGVQPGPEAVALAEQVAASPHLRFGGLQAYHGSAQHLRTMEERQRAIGGAVDGTRRTVEQLRQRGLHCDIVGGAGTGTFEIEAASGVYSEIQAGSYCFMDADYARNGGGTSAGFRHALFVLSTVMSQARPGLGVLDAGHKAVAIDSGLPLVWERDGVRYAGASDEHGKLLWDVGDVGGDVGGDAGGEAGGKGVRLGEKLRLVPGHCDPTVDRFDWYVGVRNGRVETVFPVAARGAFT